MRVDYLSKRLPILEGQDLQEFLSVEPDNEDIYGGEEDDSDKEEQYSNWKDDEEYVEPLDILEQFHKTGNMNSPRIFCNFLFDSPKIFFNRTETYDLLGTPLEDLRLAVQYSSNLPSDQKRQFYKDFFQYFNAEQIEGPQPSPSRR